MQFIKCNRAIPALKLKSVILHVRVVCKIVRKAVVKVDAKVEPGQQRSISAKTGNSGAGGVFLLLSLIITLTFVSHPLLYYTMPVYAMLHPFPSPSPSISFPIGILYYTRL